MLNRQLTMGKSIDIIMVADARSIFASIFREESHRQMTNSQDKEDKRNARRTFATETTRSNMNEQLLIKKYCHFVTNFRPDANL